MYSSCASSSYSYSSSRWTYHFSVVPDTHHGVLPTGPKYSIREEDENKHVFKL